jgi:Transposase and inactivated derivatives
MTDVIVSAEAVEEVKPAGAPDALDDQLIGQLVDRAKAGGIKLTGEGGLLQQLTKRLLESALEGEITDHLGHEKHERAADGNTRNGTRSKTVVTEDGAVLLVRVPVAALAPDAAGARQDRGGDGRRDVQMPGMRDGLEDRSGTSCLGHRSTPTRS